MSDLRNSLKQLGWEDNLIEHYINTNNNITHYKSFGKLPEKSVETKNIILKSNIPKDSSHYFIKNY